MTDSLGKIIKWILLALMIVSAVLGLLFYLGSVSEEFLMQWGYILLAITTALAVISPIYSFIINPKNILKLIIFVGLAVVIGVIAYSISGNSFSELELVDLKVTAQTSHNVGAGLYFTYIAAILALFSIVFSGVMRILK